MIDMFIVILNLFAYEKNHFFASLVAWSLEGWLNLKVAKFTVMQYIHC